jgi:hypothetical protein
MGGQVTLSSAADREQRPPWARVEFISSIHLKYIVACEIDVGENGCSGTLQVMNQIYTLLVNVTSSKLDNCNPKEDRILVTVHSNPKYCDKYEFYLFCNAPGNPNQVHMKHCMSMQMTYIICTKIYLHMVTLHMV